MVRLTFARTYKFYWGLFFRRRIFFTLFALERLFSSFWSLYFIFIIYVGNFIQKGLRKLLFIRYSWCTFYICCQQKNLPIEEYG